MKKIFILIITVFLLSGCTVEYNVNFTKDLASEKVILNGVINETFPVEAYINDQGASEEMIEIEGIEYYDITKTPNSTDFTYDFPMDRYVESSGVNMCYKYVSIVKMNDETFNILTSKYNSCINYYPELEQINVNLHFTDDFNIISNNADKVENNTYTWIIDRNNYDKKSIELSYSFKEETKNKIDRKNNILFIVGSFVVLAVVLIIVLRVKNKMMNRG